MSFFRTLVASILLVSLALPLPADKKKKKPSDEEGMVLEVSTKQKKKKGDEDLTQTLPAPKEAPGAVVADTGKLFFQVSTLSSRGLLSQQTREAMRALLRSPHGAGIVKLRAFVAGSGDMRRIQEIAGEVFAAQHLALPAITVMQAGALPLEGAQVVIESIGSEKRTVNPHGVAFLSGQAGDSVAQSLEKIQAAFRAAGMSGSDILKVTCFVSSLEESRSGVASFGAAFPGAALNFVQMQRGPVNPNSECEAVARLRTPPEKPAAYVNPAGVEPPNGYSQMALVRTPKLAFSSMQMGFGNQENDVRLAFERLRKAMGAVNARLDRLVMSHVYLISMSMAERVRGVRKGYYNAEFPPASTLLPFEGLPSIDASFGVDVVGVVE